MTESLTRRLGRAPSVNEIAVNLDLTAEEVLEGMEVERGRRALSMDAGGDSESDEAPPIADLPGGEDPGYATVEYGTAIAPVVDELSERAQEILRLRFVEDLTQSEIGARLGISQMHVSRILRAIVQRLREQVRGDESGPDG